MTYDREKLLNMLSTAPLYKGMIFHEGKNDDFFNSMDNDFNNYYNYAYGATKLAIIPVSEKEDYVIKIPYTGCYNYESGYYINSFYHPTQEDYWDYCNSESDERCWDYCAGEVNRYRIAAEKGFSHYFAKTELLGYINDYPIYIQEKCITFKSCQYRHIHTKEEKMITSNCCNYYNSINEDWLTDFRLFYGKEILFNFINFICNLNWDDDLRDDNIGYIKNRPVLIDYSGFLD